MTINEIIIPEARSGRYFLKGQGLHAAAALVLIPIAWAFAAPAFEGGSYWGISAQNWFWLAIGVAVVHQILVWLVFRGQLGWGIFTRLFGRSDLLVWGILFLPLLAARPIFVYGLAQATQDSLLLPGTLALLIGFGLLVPCFFTLASVAKYFGIRRALGGDHFRISYRKMPLVSKGAFRYSDNAMYAFAFLGLWSIALLLGSQAALSAALFQHVFVWAHYYGTEKPDMELIYGGNQR